MKTYIINSKERVRIEKGNKKYGKQKTNNMTNLNLITSMIRLNENGINNFEGQG